MIQKWGSRLSQCPGRPCLCSALPSEQRQANDGFLSGPLLCGFPDRKVFLGNSVRRNGYSVAYSGDNQFSVPSAGTYGRASVPVGFDVRYALAIPGTVAPCIRVGGTDLHAAGDYADPTQLSVFSAAAVGS
jgi:hypothetical protein